MSDLISKSDATHLRAGIRASKRGNWRGLNAEKNKANDPSVKDILTWVRTIRDPHVPFGDLTYVTQQLSNWPRMSGIRSKAEARLFDKPLSPQRTIDWFLGQDPVSGEGRAALANAYYQLNDKVRGDLWLKSAWRNSKLTRERQRTLYKKYKSRLSADDHAARADHLIWLGRRHFSKVDGLISLLNKTDRALIDARVRVSANRKGMDRAISAVPSTHKADTGLLFERARWRRIKKTKDYALPVYKQIKTPPLADHGKKALWTEKKIMSYWAIQEKKFQDAYDLTLNHGLTRGTSFAEAEFLAGWLALQKLGQAGIASQHFETLRNGVSTPVSVSRAAYWQGRAADSLSDGNARAYYSEAASFPNTYYGQLAAEKLSGTLSEVILPPEAPTEALQASFMADPRVRAMQLLGEAREERFFSMFAFMLDDEFDDIRELSLLSQLSKNLGYMRPSLRAAKQAGRLQTMLTDSGYPVIEAINALSTDKFNVPFVFAIARQESEFEPNVISHAKAHGLMQMINSTARTTARKHRIPYNRSRMTSDIDYSAKLGALHLNDLLKQFDGSYIMAAAAYNAGASRVKTWNRKHGDPRKGEIDPIDWVESIPFSETRNYVQRVMENMQVYRARLNDNRSPNLIARDLSQGAF